MEGAGAGLIRAVPVQLVHHQPAVLGQKERAPVGERDLGRGAALGADLVALDELGAGCQRHPLALALLERLDLSDDLLDLGGHRHALRLRAVGEGEHEHAGEERHDDCHEQPVPP